MAVLIGKSWRIYKIFNNSMQSSYAVKEGGREELLINPFSPIFHVVCGMSVLTHSFLYSCPVGHWTIN